MAAVEKSLSSLDGVISARVNLSMKRAAVRWRAVEDTVPDLIGSLERIGYRAHLFTLGADAKDTELPRLVRALAVAAGAKLAKAGFGEFGDTDNSYSFSFTLRTLIQLSRHCVVCYCHTRKEDSSWPMHPPPS